MQIEKNIAATLQRRMDEAGKTKLEFSRDLGIPRSTLQGYLRGEKGLRSDSIEELAKRLGMSPAQLISGPGAAEAVSPAANAASSLAQHSLVRALAEEIVEAVKSADFLLFADESFKTQKRYYNLPIAVYVSELKDGQPIRCV